MDRDVLRHPMHVRSREGTERFQELYQQALDALDRAPDGQGIAAGEWAFRDAFLQLMKESYQAGLQSHALSGEGKVNAHPTAQAAAFSPCESRSFEAQDKVYGSASSAQPCPRAQRRKG
jgi:hypothetical protein